MTQQTPNSQKIHLNGVDIEWAPDQGTFTFFGTPSALFWINPSLLTMLKPLAEEIGHSLFRLEVAHSASLGTEEDYHHMVTQLGDTFEDGFLKWGEAVSAAGWGTFELLEFDLENKKALVKVTNTWELLMQQSLLEQWGCPFIQGKVIGIFNHALGVNCWADEVRIDYTGESPFVVFEIYQSQKTISLEVQNERKKIMHAKERELFREVELKTKQLANAKLKAESANLAKSKFLGSMSHELKTPLNGIIGLSKLLKSSYETLSKETIEMYLDGILESGENMNSIVSQLLSYSEVTATDTGFPNQELSLLPVIIDAINDITPLAARRHIKISLTDSLNQPNRVYGNYNYVKEVLLVFLSNACKYIPENGRVDLDIQNYQSKVRILVTDSGDGIDEKYQGQLFEAFERLDKVNSNISGAGVGLSIAKMMALHMKGEIGFSNNPEAGSTFWLELDTAKTPMS